MKNLQILAAAVILAASTSANAWWGPFDTDNNGQNNNWNNNSWNNNDWNNNFFGDMMNDMVGDMNMDMNMEMKFKLKAKGRGNADNYWNSNNNHAYNVSDYNNAYAYQPYGNTPYGHNQHNLAPVQAAPAVETSVR